ncbi:MAG TPA: class E sortase [Gaiellaceae bacterium]|jgi:sortase A
MTMRRPLRALGTGLIAVGVLALVWTVLVWRWQDPFTALYTHWKQHQLAGQYRQLVNDYRPPATVDANPNAGLSAEKHAVAEEAAAFRRHTHTGEAIGRIVIGRIGLTMILVDGTDHESLKKGPGRDLRTYMPGQNRLVYIAGHRTTYLAPFSHIDDIKPGDYIRLEMPYATFVYRAFRHSIVPATDLAALHSPRHELLRLQACHPRFFATHRYLVDARLVSVQPRNGEPYTLAALGRNR